MLELDRHQTDHDLLLALDGELTLERQRAVSGHVSKCAACQARMRELDRVSQALVAARRDTVEDASDDVEIQQRTRARLQARLRDEVLSEPALHSSWTPAAIVEQLRRSTWTRWAATAAALVAVAVAIRVNAPERLSERSRITGAIEHGALPVAALTPGATWDLGVTELCADGGSREQRQIPVGVREQVVRAYGMSGLAETQYELDYLITPELGGAPDARNLWPQRYASRVWNAHVKDQLERLLPRLVCDGQLPLGTAQHEIAVDWIAAYKKYFRTNAPLQTEARLTLGDDAGDITYPVWRADTAPSLRLIAFTPAR